MSVHNVQDNNVDSLHVTAALVSGMHEIMGHCKQINVCFHQNNSVSKVVALNRFACKASDTYYYGKGLSAYYKQPYEIVAQYAGIYHSYAGLKARFGSNQANDMICNYVNDRISKGSEFISYRQGKPYTDVKSILDEFQSTFEHRVYEHRALDRTVAMQEPSAYASYFSKNPNVGQQTYVSLCRNGVKQDLMLTSIYLREEDKNDRLREMYSSLEDVPYAPSEAISFRYYPSWIRYKDKDLQLMNLIKDVDDKQSSLSDDYEP